MKVTVSARPKDIERRWFVVDAQGMILGRLASEAARRLRGKHKAIFTPHMDTGDFIVVVNAEKVRVTGNKEEGKLYYRHSQRPGGLKTRSLGVMRQKDPEQIITRAVSGMLPKGPLGRSMLSKLKVYRGPDHPHAAQCPETVVFEEARR